MFGQYILKNLCKSHGLLLFLNCDLVRSRKASAAASVVRNAQG